MSESSATVLTVSGLRVETATGDGIVDGVSFHVGGGEVLALVGESGCGKTSVAMALLGHARPGTRIAAGSVVLDGTDLLLLSQRDLRSMRGSRIAYVPQDPTSGLNPGHRIRAQIAETLIVHGTAGKVAEHVSRSLTERVGLPHDEEFLARYPFELSGGQQQRVAIAMALACEPRVVVLDEPTTGLDVTTQARVLALLRELGRASGTAFVYVTHDLAVVDNLADRVAVLYAGRVVEAGPRAGVLRRPVHPYTTMLLASVPRLSVRRELIGIAGSAPPPGARPAGCSFEPRCPLAIDHCASEFPPETSVTDGHVTHCWRASEAQIRESHAANGEHDRQARTRVLLDVEELHASYGGGSRTKAVVHGVSFSIPAGSCLALVGESGSGKTTIGRCVAGLHEPNGGTISLNGACLTPHARDRTAIERRAVQIVFQNPDRSLNPAEALGAAIARPLRLFGLASSRTDVGALLERVRLPGAYVGRYPSELSGGEKQRAAIARALAARPSLLICDEITSALDVSIQAAIVALLEELQGDGLALLFITHNLALVNSIADDVVVLEAGHVREQGSTRDVIGAPKHAYTRELLVAAPELGAVG